MGLLVDDSYYFQAALSVLFTLSVAEVPVLSVIEVSVVEEV